MFLFIGCLEKNFEAKMFQDDPFTADIFSRQPLIIFSFGVQSNLMFSKETSYNHAHVLDLRLMSARIRKLSLESITNAGSGHPGGSLSVADILTALYFGKANGQRILNYDPADSGYAYRDRVVLSKGHAAPAWYATLAYAGFLFKDNVKHNLRRMDSILQGHPCMKHVPGVDFSSGSLGQGISAAVGLALAGKERGMDYRVFAILGDGEMQEGQVWEALLTIPNKGLDNLCVIIDCNGIQIDGTTKEINDLAMLEDKLEAFNFDTKCIDGHMYQELLDALRTEDQIYQKERPKAIIARTIKGKGVTFIEDNEDYQLEIDKEERHDGYGYAHNHASRYPATYIAGQYHPVWQMP